MTKSEIFKAAWAFAKDSARAHSERKEFFFGSWIVTNEGAHCKPSEFFAECLRSVYATIKSNRVVKAAIEKMRAHTPALDVSASYDATKSSRNNDLIELGYESIEMVA